METRERGYCPVCSGRFYDEIIREPLIFISGLGRVDYDNWIVRCRECGFVFTDPVPIQSELDRYYRLSSPHDQMCSQPLVEEIRAFIRKSLPEYRSCKPRRAKLISLPSAASFLIRGFSVRSSLPTYVLGKGIILEKQQEKGQI